MIESTFVYEGHAVMITKDTHKGKDRYWFHVDGVAIQHASNPDTAKRFVTKFIDVVNDAHYASSRQVNVYKVRRPTSS